MVNKLKCYLHNLLFGRSNQEQKFIFYTKDFFKDKNFVIGEFTYGKPNVLFENVEANLHIGKFTSIANNVTIFLGGNHKTDWISTYPFNCIPDKEFSEFNYLEGHPSTKGDVAIGNDVWIGTNATILSGVNIGDGAVIGTNSVVSKDIGPYEIWVGNPAKFIRKRFTDEQINELLKLKWWNWTLEEIKKNIPQLLSSDIDQFINKLNR